MLTNILLLVDNSVFWLAYIMMIHTMVIIMNNINYIYRYDKLNYGLFIDSSLTTTH